LIVKIQLLALVMSQHKSIFRQPTPLENHFLQLRTFLIMSMVLVL